MIALRSIRILFGSRVETYVRQRGAGRRCSGSIDSAMTMKSISTLGSVRGFLCPDDFVEYFFCTKVIINRRLTGALITRRRSTSWKTISALTDSLRSLHGRRELSAARKSWSCGVVALTRLSHRSSRVSIAHRHAGPDGSSSPLRAHSSNRRWWGRASKATLCCGVRRNLW